VRLALALVVVTTVMAGCAATPAVHTARAPRDETVVLLPGPEGTAGTVTVTHQGQQRVLDVPYASTHLREEGRLEDGGRHSADQVQQLFGDALRAQPPRPVTFVLYFLGDSDQLTPDSQQEIPKIMQEIGRHPAAEIVVIGHTDRKGPLAYNDALSLRRAERVRTQLVQVGILADQISVAGRGEREPLVATEDEVDEPRNRRVEITVR
jgi:outer membrane protein OmpA-like peptidoglycan-associated protein